MGVDHAEAYDGTSSTATHGSLVELLDKNDIDGIANSADKRGCLNAFVSYEAHWEDRHDDDGVHV